MATATVMGIKEFFSFSGKQSLVSSFLMEGFIDTHCHILPGVDDGVQTYEDSIAALHFLYSMGVRHVCLTPHIMSNFPKNTASFLKQTFEAFRQRLAEEGVGRAPTLRLCAEYMLEPAFEQHKSEGLLTYADEHVLVETSYLTPPVGFNAIIEQLLEEGYMPVLAHPERYLYMSVKDYDRLKEMGAKFQLNILSLTGAYGKSPWHNAETLLRGGYYDFAGTDFHHLERHRAAFRAKMLTEGRVEALQAIFDNNERLWQ